MAKTTSALASNSKKVLTNLALTRMIQEIILSVRTRIFDKPTEKEQEERKRDEVTAGLQRWRGSREEGERQREEAEDGGLEGPAGGEEDRAEGEEHQEAHT